MTVHQCAVVDPFAHDHASLHRRVASAWAALNGARAACNHSPNADNCAIEEMCENTMNDLLDTLWAGLTPAQQRDADSREIRETVAG